MNFRQRLALFLIVTLIGVQGVTAFFAYNVIRNNLVEGGKRELTAAAAVFMRQLNVLSEGVAADVETLSLDYALRSAVAGNDRATALSALKNHGDRIGASRMMLVGLDGTINADTAHPDAPADSAGKAFPFAGLLTEATSGDSGTALAVLDGSIDWIVVVPVRAPLPVGFIAACLPVNDAFLEKMRQLSPLPQSLALATPGAKSAWTVKSRSKDYSASASLIARQPLAQTAAIVTEQQGDHLTMMARLTTAKESAPVIAVIDYPLDEALAAFRAVITPMLLVLGASLLIAIAGAVLIARGVSRPLESLAAAARRIGEGDYRPPPALRRGDEIGQLSGALDVMTRSIAERETALKGAVASLEVARNDAVKANEAKSQFLSNMSHELRTPLNAIIGFSEMIHRQIVGPVGIARYVDYARDIHDAGIHLLLQVQAMLDLSDAADGHLSITREMVKPGELLKASLAQLRASADEAEILIQLTDEPSDWPDMVADASKLQLSLTNIIQNAIKFTPSGGKIEIGGTARDGRFTLTVADTGIGIAREDIELVTKPFHRRKAAFDARHQGAGLGLPFAKMVVELHGGTLVLASEPNKGTTVTIVLPLNRSAALHHAA